jgi:uncharacterized damage-inducible protein DinB
MEIKELISSDLEQCRGGINRTLQGLSDDEINWHPHSDANSIAPILFHLARLEDSMISTLSGKPSLWDTDKWYVKLHKDQNDRGAHYTTDQVAKFAMSNVKDLLAYYDAARARTMDFLKSVSPERFDEKVNMPAPPPPPKDAPLRPAPPRRPEPTVGRMLAMILNESLSHGGEISYIRGLKRGMDK